MAVLRKPRDLFLNAEIKQEDKPPNVPRVRPGEGADYGRHAIARSGSPVHGGLSHNPPVRVPREGERVLRTLDGKGFVVERRFRALAGVLFDARADDGELETFNDADLEPVVPGMPPPFRLT